jgi:hypothetical protein
MSNVLVIEPRKILQHATTIALFPDHEARIVDAIPEAALVYECDAVIVDAVALREINALSAQALRAMEEWKVPTVWIDGDAPQPPGHVPGTGIDVAGERHGRAAEKCSRRRQTNQAKSSCGASTAGH